MRKSRFSENQIIGLLKQAEAGRPVAELNRMWLSDVAPRNSESGAISQAIKYIRRAMPTVA